MIVKVLYFAGIREGVRRSEEDVEVPAGTTAGDLLSLLSQRHQPVSAVRAALRMAVNEGFVDLSHVLGPGDEVALIPPVAGGGPYCRLTAEPLDEQEVVRAVTRPEQGAIVTFCGVVRGTSRGRSVTRLEYEAYGGMARRTMANLIDGLERQYPGVHVALVHRTGTLLVGEAAVIIAASAPHREDAFAACKEAIERLKQDVPIWKKEITEDGELWVSTRP